MGEVVTRLAPNAADEWYVERVGATFRRTTDFIKIPNFKKEG